MIPHWLCWTERVVKHVARHGIKHHRRHRIGRAIRRTAGVVASKPAAVVWVCVATGGGMWAGGVPGWSQPPAPASVAQAGIAPFTGVEIGGEIFPLPPGLPPTLGPPLLPPGLPPTIEFPVLGPPTLVPEIPTTPPVHPVPEPASVLLLAAGLAALFAWRRT